MTVLDVAPPDANGVCRMTLNRPERANAIDSEIADALLAALQTAHRDGTRILLLMANGKNFSGGFDLSGYEEASEGDLVLRFARIEQALQILDGAPFVSIACAQGAAFGAGADLVAACTFRLGTPSSRFRFPGYRFGVALGTRRLAALVGAACAREILISGRTLGSEESAACGLLTRVVGEGDMDATVGTLIEQVSAFDAPALAALLANTRVPHGDGDRDLAELVRSIARPGLHARIRQYLEERTAPPKRRE
jgi:enoyl-CoA hydratase/carnithine racemase